MSIKPFLKGAVWSESTLFTLVCVSNSWDIYGSLLLLLAQVFFEKSIKESLILLLYKNIDDKLEITGRCGLSCEEKENIYPNYWNT